MSETWVWNDLVSGSLSSTRIQFIADNNLYNRISATVHTIHAMDVTALYYDDERPYESQAGVFEFGKTITFLTKPSGSLLTYLQANATKKDVIGLKNLSSYNQPTSVASMKDVATKQDTINLTTNRALVSDSSGKVAVSAVTSTELGCLHGVNSNVQQQLSDQYIRTAEKAYYIFTAGTLSDNNIIMTEEAMEMLIDALEKWEPGGDYYEGYVQSDYTEPVLVCSDVGNVTVYLKVASFDSRPAGGRAVFSGIYSNSGNYYQGFVIVNDSTVEYSGRIGIIQSVNGKTGNVVLTPDDIGAVPTTRTVNNKALSSDITLNASDVGAIPNVPVTTTNNLDMLMVLQGNWQTDHGEAGIQDAASLIVNKWPDNVTMVVKSFRRWGKLCLFTVQINVGTQISTNYGFTLLEMPYASIDRVWINNQTQFYMDYNKVAVRVNDDKLATGHYALTGFYLTTDNAKVV